MTKEKVIAMFSGGLDSRLVIKMMQEQGLEVLALFFNLPFGSGCCNEGCSFSFAQKAGVKLKVVDATKGELLQEYLKIIEKAKHGRGAGVNPCIDCRIFMFKHAKKIADDLGIETIVSGEVLSQRPMSQMKKKMITIEEETGLEGRLFRPLSAKILPETNIEKKRIVNREEMGDIHGRQRVKQMALAKKYKIDYPSPAGGCVLCEKMMIKRFELVFKRGLDEKELPIVTIGRQFIIDDAWIITGRDKKENDIIEFVAKKTGELITADDLSITGPSAIILNANMPGKIKVTEEIKAITEQIIRAYSKDSEVKDRKGFEKFKL
ncbi:7-cyano-7-deazaguanine synthase [Candidatus Pacearchaeota archaeon]|nr:7-cyano-7-deazaguanine synthase [Candidatus Pacearchaeota archaeon]